MLKVSVSPHIRNNESIPKIMWTVNIALLPALISAYYFYGIKVLWVILVSVVSAVLTEFLIQFFFRKPITVFDGSAFVTGLLLAYNLPPSAPLYIPAVGSFFAIAIVKHLFGGLGNNIFNPALSGRVFVMFAWLPEMTRWTPPSPASWFGKILPDVVSKATPLASKMQGLLAIYGTKYNVYLNLFLGNIGGCIGENCKLALLLGALILFAKKYITCHIPFSYIITVGIITWIFGPNGFGTGDAIYHILSGGLILGAFFMATDMVTTPITKKGQLIFGIGCGLITSLIRLKGGFPEGVSFSILLMNALTPLIDKYVKPKKFGSKK